MDNLLLDNKIFHNGLIKQQAESCFQFKLKK